MWGNNALLPPTVTLSRTDQTHQRRIRHFSAPAQKGHPYGWPSALSDAWQFMAGVLPATLRAVASQRSNPLPA
ncbi:hypothetical protein, partial [Escherichia sp. MR]|uniref:hypothetical protein n=1 Tax=Escherichia sp. MR TaxID=2575922 RepID=UPI00197AC84D